jgi:VanZ family protein
LEKKQPAIWPALAWFIITTILLCLPGSAFPKENWFNKLWLDKWVHIGLFAIMVFLWCRGILSTTKKKTLAFTQIAFYFFLYGIVMEFIQKYFIPNRSFDIGDIIADGAGSVAGLFLSIRLYIKK